MPAIFFALLSYFSWAIGDTFGAVAARRSDAYSLSLWSYIFRLIIFAVYIPFGLSLLSNLTLPLFILNIVLGILLLVGIIAFNEALRISSAPLVGTIAASFVAVSVLLSIIFLGETLDINQTFSILLIFSGLILSTLDLKSLVKKKIKLDKGIYLAFVPMLFWGIYFAFIRIPVSKIGFFWPNYISFLLFPLILVYTKSRKLKIKNITKTNAFLPLLVGTFLIGVAEFSYNFAISKNLTAIVAPIAGSYPTLFVLLTYFVFKDKISKQQIAGIITTLVGIVLLSMFSA